MHKPKNVVKVSTGKKYVSGKVSIKPILQMVGTFVRKKPNYKSITCFSTYAAPPFIVTLFSYFPLLYFIIYIHNGKMSWIKTVLDQN